MKERLQKYMASCGVASRRKCEEIILSGRVTVNDKLVTELGSKIDTDIDKVFLDGILINKEEFKRYIILNKPVGIITSVKDEKNRKTVLDIVDVNERVYPVGRLDYDSSGLLLLTNDGEFYNKIIHPRVEVNKVYIAKVSGTFTKEDISKFENGIDIGGYITAKSKIKVIKQSSKESVVEIIIHEGKNRQIRRMCSALNHDVISLKRVAIGNIKLGNLKPSEYRELNKSEIDYINTL
ncbi:MAG: pseudouridine synthase [Clostridium sp.]|uniref:pseudouridine synthase n=1 Tax=Clostridium TaxID=1485 RepID=UPI0021523EA9|nr:pseudouridine synthase [Clostridium sp. LY3-2]MCR6515780.1 rRNA pseudouridine synthase [Clostridium sp. LY3-2]